MKTEPENHSIKAGSYSLHKAKKGLAGIEATFVFKVLHMPELSKCIALLGANENCKNLMAVSHKFRV